MKKLILSIVIVLLLTPISKAQEVGSWKEFLSFSYAFDIAHGSEKVYCVTKGGLFYYNINDNSIEIINSLTGLNDFDIVKIAYSTETQMLMVAYQNCNIDLIYNGSIVNLSDIYRKSIIGDKSINNIYFNGSEAYISCGFGIVVINLEKQEVKDTYIIGDEGSQLAVNDITINGDTIYAATDEGVYTADIKNSNLLDFQSWSQITSIDNYNGRFTEVETFNGKVIALWDGREMYENNTGSWDRYLSYVGKVKNINAGEKYLTITGDKIIYIIDQNQQQFARVLNYPGVESEQNNIGPLNAVYNENTGLWIADYYYSLIKASNDQFESIYPDGPVDNDVFYLYANGNDLWVAPGCYSRTHKNSYNSPHFQLYRDNSWSNFTSEEIPELADFSDVVHIIAHPSDKDHLFVSVWGGGLFELKNGEFLNRYSNHNSQLQTAMPDKPDAPYVRIGGLAFDSEGNLWMTNSQVTNVLKVLKTDGEWESFYLSEIKECSMEDIIITEDDDKWVVANRGDNLYVVNKDGSEKKYLKVKSYFNNGETKLIVDMNDIYSIVEDKEGAVWLGTSKGVAVYFNPERVWEDDFLYATHPSLDIDDGLYHPILQSETVTAIAVDGANRKWMGTEDSGVYLFSEDGEEEILHFTEDDSPLLSNSIISIAINPNSGEVFIGTEDGIVSYQGDAIEGHSSYNNALVYPNPVRETYDGPIVVTGLLEETDVKITDISGNLVYSTTSLGGQATWDGLNLNGNRVKTGVYLIFLSDKNGEETHILKLLFIN